MAQLLLKGVPIGTIKGVLFDKDGTLSNSEDHLLAIANLRIEESKHIFRRNYAKHQKVKSIERLLTSAYGLTEHGIHPSGTLAVASRSQNLISTATIFCLLGAEWPKAFDMANEVFNRVDLLTTQRPDKNKKQTLLPGVQRLLKDLQKANVFCALISNDTTCGIRNFLKTNNLEEAFLTFWSADNQPTKPSADAVKKLCNLLGVLPIDCALIGDADSDLQMARQAGVGITLGYVAGWTQSPQLSAHQHLIYHWDDLRVEAKPKLPKD